MIPILVILFKIKIQVAIAAVVFSLFPAAIISTIFNTRDRLVDPVVAMVLEVPTIFGTILGAYLSSILSVQVLEGAFAFFLLFVAKKMLFPEQATNKKKSLVSWLNQVGPMLKRQKAGAFYQLGAGAVIFFGGISGLVAGMFGIGGGFLKTPIMIKVFRMPAKVAVATALFMIIFTSLTASITHVVLGHGDWHLAVPLCIGFSLGSLIGSLLKSNISELHTEKLIGLGLSLAAVSTLIHAFYS